MHKMRNPLYLLLLGGLSAMSLAAEIREQVISREDPAFRCREASLTVGRDGLVYLTCGHQSGYVLRLSRDGQAKQGSPVVYAIRNATANADGIVASANAHFNHAVNVYDRKFQPVGVLNDFLVSDQVGWDAPAHVEAGASGDFYGVDQHRDRILRVSPWGKLVTAYPIPREPAGNPGQCEEFRVCEANQTFYVRNRQNQLRCVGFDGKSRWTMPTIGGGAFDIDDAGVLYVIAQDGTSIKKVSAVGQPVGEVALLMAEFKPGPGLPVTSLRICGSDAVLKRAHETELFQTYSLTTGQRKHVASIEHEQLRVTFPSLIWIAGQRIPFQIEFVPRSIRPRWRVWATTFGASDWRELTLADGQLHVPPDLAGLYLLKVSPESQPAQTGTAAEYVVHEVVEVRQGGTQGTVNVFTPDNREYFGRGEELAAAVLVRSPTTTPQAVAVRLVERTAAESAALWDLQLTVSPGQPAAFRVPAAVTERLRPGRYKLTAAAPGLTGVPQPLSMGPGVRDRSPFFFTQYGDYGVTYPHDVAAWEAADAVRAHVARQDRLGLNLFVDRLGVNLQYGYLKWGNTANQVSFLNALTQRLTADPHGVAPEKSRLAPTLQQTMAAYSSAGVQQMAILMGNDAGLPLGSGFDNRKPEQILEDLRLVTGSLLPYRAFRGWDWSSNWWVFDKRGSAAALTSDEKSAYEAALKRALETGIWDAVLDRVAARRLGLAVEAQELFQKSLNAISAAARQSAGQTAPQGFDLVTASACPFRNVESYPPISLSNVDETDLQAQWEQIALPQHAAFGVDFYKRSGKRAWGHPEIWNDPGTGEQIVPTLFQMLMRGADGIGCSGTIPPWGRLPDDSRISYYGTPSVYRAVGGLVHQYGPWLRTLENRDRVAIICSGRMFKIDDWTNTMGRHFARVYEAYISCLAAHRPASLVFAEDLQAEGLLRFAAVLVIDQRVEFEPALAVALQRARAAKVAVFCDSTCRNELVKDFVPLGITCNKIESGHQAGLDLAYVRFREVAREHAVAISRALNPLTPPLANPSAEVFVSERQAEDGRYLFVVNQTLPPLDPGLLWRVSLNVASCIPVQTRIPAGPTVPGSAIYDVFALREVQPQNGSLTADLRSLPARIFAVLPAAIDRVGLRGTSDAWTVHVLDKQGQPIRAAIPIRVQLLDAHGAVVEEQFVVAGSQGVRGQLNPPSNVPASSLQATELFSGKATQLTVKSGSNASSDRNRREPLASAPVPVANAFGPHIRDLVLTEGHSLAVMNTMNWDHNLYAVDVGSGQIRWRQRVGQYFSFAPQSLEAGVAVQGFDLTSAEGYQLSLIGRNGQLERRFALYGLPQRLPHRFVPSIVRDRINSFAVPRSGAWVATAGDLGLAAWARDGRLLWSQDWWKTERHPATLAALDADTLLVVEGLRATAYHAADGKPRWQLTLAPEGEVQAIRVSRDGRTWALAATTQGGRIFVVHDGQLTRTFPTATHQLELSPDGSTVAVATAQQLKLYSVADGLQWIRHGDDTWHHPRFSADGKRVAVSTALGTVCVLDTAGSTLAEKDLGALAVPAWLPDGDLLLGTWMGRVCRLDGQYAERWSTRLTPDEMPLRTPPANNPAPITRVASWGNAAATPLPLAPNLLSAPSTIVRLVAAQSHLGLARDAAALMDGKADAPAEPWIEWANVESFAETSPFNYLLLDTFHTRLRVNAITLVEDPAHPESWLRDAGLDYWDAQQEKWVPVQPLLSDAAVHTHMLAKPVEAARFRLTLPWGLCGNLRLAEIVLHGERLGCSHPDAAARRSRAVLFDEQESDLQCLRSGGDVFGFKYDGAYSGTKCLLLAADKTAMPAWQPPLGHRVPNWNFDIVEKPEPGQYRYLQFAWRALTPDTKGLTLRVAEAHFGGVSITAGQESKFEGAVSKKVADQPPQNWQVVRVDLWDVFRKPVRLGSLGLGTVGGPAAFDQILLGRSESDLPPVK